MIPEDESVILLSHEPEELDYTLFKILTYAYSQNIYSSRKIEIACRRDINFMWLIAGQKASDLHHSRLGSRNGYTKTDADAIFMHMKDDHMKNGKNEVLKRI